MNPLWMLVYTWNTLGNFFWYCYLVIQPVPLMDWFEARFYCLSAAHFAGANVYLLDGNVWEVEAATWSWLRKMREFTTSLVRGHGVAALACYAAYMPCATLGDVFLFFSNVWNSLTVIFFDAAALWDVIVEKVVNILTWDNIRAYILGWLPDLERVVVWWLDRWNQITSVITNWWGVISGTVQGWIEVAKQWAKELIDQVGTLLGTLQEVWDEFKEKIPSIVEVILWWSAWWANILPSLTSWWNERLLDIQRLLDSAIADWFPFYDDLVEIWESIKEFFVNPFEWIQTHVIEPIVEDFNQGFDRGMKDEED